MDEVPESTRRDPIAEAHRQWSAHGWSDAADGMAAVTTLVRAHQVVTAHIDDLLRPFGLTFARFEVLRLLSFTRAGSLPMGRMGALLQVHPASVTNAVGRLEAAGLVRRVANPHDQRSTLAEILPAGRRLVEEATTELNEFFVSVEDVTDVVAVRDTLSAMTRGVTGRPSAGA